VRRDAPRGFALVIVLLVIVLLSGVLGGAILYSRQDRLHAAKSVHNLGIQQATETTLQFGRQFFARKQTFDVWSTYLSYFLSARTFTRVSADHPELIPQFPAGTNYNCFVYARDDVDELPPAAVNPSTDNNMRIFVGAVCATAAGITPSLTAELIAPLEYNPNDNRYTAQASGGTDGANNNQSSKNNGSALYR
jgi:hypothetical protein